MDATVLLTRILSMKSLHRVKCVLRSVGLISAALTAAVSLSARSSHATLISGSQIVQAPGEPDPTGGMILASLTVPVVAPTFSGSLTSQVIDFDPSNTLGGLTFTYALTNNATSAHAVTSPRANARVLRIRTRCGD